MRRQKTCTAIFLMWAVVFGKTCYLTIHDWPASCGMSWKHDTPAVHFTGCVHEGWSYAADQNGYACPVGVQKMTDQKALTPDVASVGLHRVLRWVSTCSLGERVENSRVSTVLHAACEINYRWASYRDLTSKASGQEWFLDCGLHGEWPASCVSPKHTQHCHKGPNS